MRKDLNKLLCERERRGSSNHFKNFRHLKSFTHARGEEFEELPAREAMKRRYQRGWQQKEFGENLNPLYGFVRKNVNRPWDKVYSELCEVFDMSSVINQHILEHLDSMVEKGTFIEDDVICFRTIGRKRWGTISLSPVLHEDGPEYFVHPTTGILLKNHLYVSWRQERNRRTREWKATHGNTDEHKIISDTLELRKRNDVWFACEIAPINKTEVKRRTVYGVDEPVDEVVTCYRYDMWMHDKVDHYGKSRSSWYKKVNVPNPSKTGTYCKTVRTASHKELKQHGVI